MRLKDSINYALKKVLRKKKNIYFIIILAICTSTIIGALYYRATFLNRLRIDLKDIFYNRAVIAWIDGNQDSYTQILNIPHVTEIYDFNYHSYNVISPTFKNDKYTGNITFKYGSKNTLPRNIEGKSFDKNDTGVAICPKNFYPSIIQNVNYFDSKLFLTKNDILNTTFTTKRTKIIRVDGKLVEDGYYIKDFKIIGVYDQIESDGDVDVCYISGKDSKEIYENTTIALNETNQLSMVVAIDSKDNLKKVNTELIKLGYDTSKFYYVDAISSLNIKFISNIAILITTVSITILTVLYISKKSIENNSEVGILKSLGFKNRDIQLINFIEITLIAIISYITGLLIIGLVFLIINTVFKNYLIIHNITIYHSLISYLISFLIIVIIPILTNHFYTYKNSKKKTITILKEEN